MNLIRDNSHTYLNNTEALLMTKKTFKVDNLREMVNYSLANSDADQLHQLDGMIAILEQVLHETGNYHGFRYLEQREVPDDCFPGIRHEQEDKFQLTNGLRRHYY